MWVKESLVHKDLDVGEGVTSSQDLDVGEGVTSSQRSRCR